MDYLETSIEGAFFVKLDRREDERGFFARVWCSRELEDRGLASRFVQCNMSRSGKRGTIRGLHYQQPPHQEAKLVRCTRGAVYDVIIDLRSGSPTRHLWEGFELHASGDYLLYVPAGCAHGIQTLEDDSEILYAVSAFYSPEVERGLRWNDPFFGIDWPDVGQRIVSEKDADWPDFQPAEPE